MPSEKNPQITEISGQRSLQAGTSLCDDFIQKDYSKRDFESYPGFKR